MSPIALALLIFGVMLVLMALRTPIAISMFVAGVVGYVLRKFRYEMSPLVLALVLAPLLRQSLREDPERYTRIAEGIKGVTEGYSEKLEVVGVGYSVKVNGKKLDLKLGYANLITLMIPLGVKVDITTEGGIFVNISGADRQRVGEFAAAIRSQRKPEPYNGKGIKYFGETIIRKQGKATGG